MTFGTHLEYSKYLYIGSSQVSLWITLSAIFQDSKKARSSWTWKSPNGLTKTAIDYIPINRLGIGTNVRVIDHIYIQSGHRMAMITTKMDVAVEMKVPIKSKLE